MYLWFDGQCWERQLFVFLLSLSNSNSILFVDTSRTWENTTELWADVCVLLILKAGLFFLRRKQWKKETVVARRVGDKVLKK